MWLRTEADLGDESISKLGGEFHESKVAGDLASASSGLYRMDSVLLCDFDGFGLFVRL